uniref:NADH-ubiquinone oxidoreductase chain 4L n=1 Tax=Rena humilis TaxID=711330 RepID=Q6I7X9_RENHU|nr:NADH dehydrogenase subunit 4L [Rena humilis]BAD24745.1 NADH dehydrogenase subunit 4L [Rena humilis]
MTTTQLTLTTIFILSMAGLSTQQAHFVSALLCIEATMLSIFISMITHAHNTHSMINMCSPTILLSLSACEAAIGLSLMIATMRTHGSDNLALLNLLKC